VLDEETCDCDWSDAADPSLLEAWMSLQKNLSSTRPGAYTRLNNLDYYRAETPWTTFLTGCLPEKTGYWAPVKLREGTYNIEKLKPNDFADPPFYALGG